LSAYIFILVPREDQTHNPHFASTLLYQLSHGVVIDCFLVFELLGQIAANRSLIDVPLQRAQFLYPDLEHLIAELAVRLLRKVQPITVSSGLFLCNSD
jgi:hypothetical protein